MKTFSIVAVLGLMAAACGGTTQDVPAPAPADTTPAADDTPAPADTSDTPAAPALDYGAPSTNYPAFKPAIAQLVNNGGKVLKAPTVITITWNADSHQKDFEALGDAIGKSSYWKAVTSEYGVGAGTSGSENHVELTDDPPANLDDRSVVSFIEDHINASTDPWPKATDAIYIVYVPTTTTFKLQGQVACDIGVGGYHDSTVAGGGAVAYAVVPQCMGFDETTLSASHELAEAATDPYPMSAPAWYGFDDNDVAWAFFNQFQTENGDACEFYRDSELGPNESDVGFTVQRQWSNESAAAGHDPCVPAIPGHDVYFSTTPLDLEDVPVDLSALGGDSGTTKGFKVNVGETKKIAIGFYSDGAMNDWTIKAVEGGIMGGQKGRLTLALDKTSGQNGEKAYIDVTVNAQGRTKTELMTIVSSHNGTTHYTPILISSPK